VSKQTDSLLGFHQAACTKVEFSTGFATIYFAQKAADPFQLVGIGSSFREVKYYFAHLRFVVLRGRPTFRFFTASRSFGSITHMFPTLVAFSRPLPIIARTLLGVTFKRLAASATLMRFMAQV
jgi:hypothetical protein